MKTLIITMMIVLSFTLLAKDKTTLKTSLSGKVKSVTIVTDKVGTTVTDKDKDGKSVGSSFLGPGYSHKDIVKTVKKDLGQD